MSELFNFPFKLQLHAPVIDGHPDINKGMNCVPTCIAAGLQYFTGKEYEGNALKDAVYGASYKGATAAVSYVEYCAKQGVRLFPVSGSPVYLVAQAHEYLARGRPVLGTVPYPYLPPKNRMDPGLSHVIAFYKDSVGTLIAMNPLQSIAQANMDQWWTERLCFDQLWIMERSAPQVNIPSGWKDDGAKLTAPNGKTVRTGFRSWVLAHTWHPDDMPIEEEHPCMEGTQQQFRSIVLEWDHIKGVHQVYWPDVLGDVQSDTTALRAELAVSQQGQKELHAQVEALKAQLLEAQKTVPMPPVQDTPPSPSPSNPSIKAKLETLADYLEDIIKQA